MTAEPDRIVLEELAGCEYCHHGFFYPERIVPLHSMLIGCGYDLKSGVEYEWNGLKRGPKPIAIWQYTLSGRGALRLGDTLYPIEPGRAMLLNVPEDHCYFLPSDAESWQFIHITMNGSELIRLWREIRGRYGSVCSFDSGSRSLNTFLEIFRLARKKRIKTPFAASRYAYDFIMAVMEDLRKNSGESSFNTPEFVSAAMHYCLDNFAGAITVADIAAVSGLSKFHFSREFRRHTGMSPAEYLQELRIRQAMRLLQNTHKTVKEIAFACGYDDCSYFCRVFRRACGVPPGSYRDGTRS